MTYFLSFSRDAQRKAYKALSKDELEQEILGLLDGREVIEFTTQYDSPFLYSSSVFCQVQMTSFPFLNLS